MVGRGVFTRNRLRLMKRRYSAMSTVNLESLLTCVDTVKEADLIRRELKKR